ncbi:GNAT family N-acetyltransferase [Candidatus Woesebacteria bacterium]|nr:GNAT family N-acetyltransferase [Candidatus Woesebacteria bacterium]
MLTTSFTTKSGKNATIRPVTIDDVPAETDFINSASREDTYITFSGEQLTEIEERAYIQDCLNRMDKRDLIKLVCIVDGVLAADCTVGRDINTRKRGYHRGTFGLVVRKEYRGNGIGETLMKTAMSTAWQRMKGLQIVTLHVLGNNLVAQKLYEKQGFVECGRVKNGYWYRDAYVDDIMMQIHKPPLTSMSTL